MLKLVYSTLVLVLLSGCASHSHPVETRQVYIERQVIIPNRGYQCQQYVSRERNCWNMQFRDTRAMCIEDARQHYNSCMSK